MKRILYASRGFLTDDAIAHALMDYASVLAVVGSSDVVECKGIDEDGKVRGIQMLVGPASQIMAMDADGDAAELNVEQTVMELKRRARWRLPDYMSVGETTHPSDGESDGEARTRG